eukprot:6832171-Prymnesium_polylepis.1
MSAALEGQLHACLIGTDAVEAAANEVRRLWSRAFAGISGDVLRPHAHSSVNDLDRTEFIEHFRPRGYDNAGQELGAQSVAGLLALLQLTADERFVDLGSSEGRVPLAVAHLTSAQAVGIELSPARHESATIAQRRLSDSTNRVHLLQADFLEPGLLTRALSTQPRCLQDTVWCAVRARQGRITNARLLEAVRHRHVHRTAALGDSQTRTRLLLAGFALPEDAEGVTLNAGYCFVRSPAGAVAFASGAPVQYEHVMPLFGDEHRTGPKGGLGPKLILEYFL